MVKSTAGKKPRIPGSHRGLGSSLLIITGQGADEILLMHFTNMHICVFFFEVLGMYLKVFYILGKYYTIGSHLQEVGVICRW